ncbi:redoxin family protein [Roseivirga sp. BDSF3-8]|uniref:redoxin family protein n=1 Tax=Roseivirga sp. BDSF3-8 TaxID=3241598 RepID=UPI003531E654
MKHLKILLPLLIISLLSTASRGPDKEKDTKDHPMFSVKLNTLSKEEFDLSKVKAKAMVIVVMAPECPLSRSYTLTINKLAEKYKRKGIEFFALFPGKDLPLMDIVEFQRKYKLKPQVLLDNDYRMVDMLRASVTPEAFLIDAYGETRYSGAIDNWVYSLTKKRQVITRHYLDDAINSMVTGFPLEYEKTQPIGCFINAPIYGN